MDVKFRGNVLEIEKARIIFRNFEGRGDKFNRAGDKNFAVIIPNQEICDQLVEAGWNVTIKAPREEGEEPFMYLKVKIKYNEEKGTGPAVYVLSGNNTPTRLNNNTIKMLDDIDIASVDMDIRPYDWVVNGKEGRTAYLQAMEVTQNIDRFAARYASDEIPF